jgi:hypothetical protein
MWDDCTIIQPISTTAASLWPHNGISEILWVFSIRSYCVLNFLAEIFLILKSDLSSADQVTNDPFFCLRGVVKMVKLSLCLTNYVMKTYGGIDV